MAAAPSTQPDAVAAATAAWDGWLDERDQAPGEVLAAWLKEKTFKGLEVAQTYAMAGLDLAKSRADVARAGSALLESGDAAKEAIRMKQTIQKAVDADAELVQALSYYGKFYRDGASSQGDAGTRATYANRGDLYSRGAMSLGAAPQAFEMTAVERDAAALLTLGEAASNMRQSFSLKVGPEAYGGALAALRTNSSDSQSTRAPSAPSSGLQDPDMPESLENPFPQPQAQPAVALAAEKLLKAPAVSMQSNLARPAGDLSMPAREYTEVDSGRNLLANDAKVLAAPQKTLAPKAAVAAQPTPMGRSEAEAAEDEKAAAKAPEALGTRKRDVLRSKLGMHRSEVEAPPAEDDKPTEAQERAVTGGFATKDSVQVWSSSKGVWLDGKVIQAFATTGVCDGYSVPAGSLKVTSSAGTKWIRPGQAEKMVRLPTK